MDNRSDGALVQQSTLGSPLAAKTVNIQIDPQDMEGFKENPAQLCFAKYVGGMGSFYTVIWYAESEFQTENTISWVPQYQLFGEFVFEPGTRAGRCTNLESIGIGETSLLNKGGMFNPPTAGGMAMGITIMNERLMMYPGLSQQLTTITGQQMMLPTYVGEAEMGPGATVLIPADKILIWFGDNVQTSFMMADPPEGAVEIDLTGYDSATATYKNGQWSVTCP